MAELLDLYQTAGLLGVAKSTLYYLQRRYASFPAKVYATRHGKRVALYDRDELLAFKANKDLSPALKGDYVRYGKKIRRCEKLPTTRHDTLNLTLAQAFIRGAYQP